MKQIKQITVYVIIPKTMLQVSNAIQVLGDLEEVMLRKGDAFRSRAYQRACHALMKHGTEEIALSSIQSEPGIGDTIYTKLAEYHNTGKNRRIRARKTVTFVYIDQCLRHWSKKSKGTY